MRWSPWSFSAATTHARTQIEKVNLAISYLQDAGFELKRQHRWGHTEIRRVRHSTTHHERMVERIYCPDVVSLAGYTSTTITSRPGSSILEHSPFKAGDSGSSPFPGPKLSHC